MKVFDTGHFSRDRCGGSLEALHVVREMGGRYPTRRGNAQRVQMSNICAEVAAIGGDGVDRSSSLQGEIAHVMLERSLKLASGVPPGTVIAGGHEPPGAR